MEWDVCLEAQGGGTSSIFSFHGAPCVDAPRAPPLPCAPLQPAITFRDYTRYPGLLKAALTKPRATNAVVIKMIAPEDRMEVRGWMVGVVVGAVGGGLHGRAGVVREEHTKQRGGLWRLSEEACLGEHGISGLNVGVGNRHSFHAPMGACHTAASAHVITPCRRLMTAPHAPSLPSPPPPSPTAMAVLCIGRSHTLACFSPVPSSRAGDGGHA